MSIRVQVRQFWFQKDPSPTSSVGEWHWHPGGVHQDLLCLLPRLASEDDGSRLWAADDHRVALARTFQFTLAGRPGIGIVARVADWDPAACAGRGSAHDEALAHLELGPSPGPFRDGHDDDAPHGFDVDERDLLPACTDAGLEEFLPEGEGAFEELATAILQGGECRLRTVDEALLRQGLGRWLTWATPLRYASLRAGRFDEFQEGRHLSRVPQQRDPDQWAAFYLGRSWQARTSWPWSLLHGASWARNRDLGEIFLRIQRIALAWKSADSLVQRLEADGIPVPPNAFGGRPPATPDSAWCRLLGHGCRAGSDADQASLAVILAERILLDAFQGLNVDAAPSSPHVLGRHLDQVRWGALLADATARRLLERVVAELKPVEGAEPGIASACNEFAREVVQMGLRKGSGAPLDPADLDQLTARMGEAVESFSARVTELDGQLAGLRAKLDGLERKVDEASSGVETCARAERDRLARVADELAAGLARRFEDLAPPPPKGVEADLREIRPFSARIGDAMRTMSGPRRDRSKKKPPVFSPRRTPEKRRSQSWYPWAVAGVSVLGILVMIVIGVAMWGGDREPSGTQGTAPADRDAASAEGPRDVAPAPVPAKDVPSADVAVQDVQQAFASPCTFATWPPADCKAQPGWTCAQGVKPTFGALVQACVNTLSGSTMEVDGKLTLKSGGLGAIRGHLARPLPWLVKEKAAIDLYRWLQRLEQTGALLALAGCCKVNGPTMPIPVSLSRDSLLSVECVRTCKDESRLDVILPAFPAK